MIVCAPYFPDMNTSNPTWASLLEILDIGGIKRLQAIICRSFELATSKIRIKGVNLVALPLFEVMDGTVSEDYVQRVEPSVEGGIKIAKALVDVIVDHI